MHGLNSKKQKNNKIKSKKLKKKTYYHYYNYNYNYYYYYYYYYYYHCFCTYLGKDFNMHMNNRTVEQHLQITDRLPLHPLQKIKICQQFIFSN